MSAKLGSAGSDDSDGDWLIDEDLPETDKQADAANAPLPWRVLIVDDDVDVHVVTKFALSNACFLGRRLSFLHAYNGAEALAMMRNTPDIAIVLLDVIMETNNAGLQVARQIREELHNPLVRIVLRTGQPGQALEHSIIVDYDINDFWCKTDLTTRKLFTTVISSLRTYTCLVQAEQRAASLTTALALERQTSALARQTLQLTLLADGGIGGANDALLQVLQYSQQQLLALKLENILHPAETAPLLQALRSGQAWAGDLNLQAGDGGKHPLKAMLIPIDNGDENQLAPTFLLTAAQPVSIEQPV